MDENELREKLADTLFWIERGDNYFAEKPNWQYDIADRVIALFDEAGWKGPEEMKEGKAE